MIKKLLIVLFLLIGAYLLYGNEAEATSNYPAFSVSPIDPDTKETLNGYYDLELAPDEERVLMLRLHNTSKEPMTLVIELNNAWTNDNGLPTYTYKKEIDRSMKYPFSTIAKTEESEIYLAAHEEKEIRVQVKMAKEPFKGQILGGIRISQAENKQASKGAVEHDYAYVIGTIVQQNKAKLSPIIDLLAVKPTQINGNNAISATIQNKEATIVRELSVDAKVYNNDKQLCYERQENAMRMAPNSAFDFSISSEAMKLMPGTYVYVLKGSADGEEFTFKKEFTISAKEANSYNRTAVYLDDQPNYPLWFVVSLVGILIAMTTVIWRKKVKQNE